MNGETKWVHYSGTYITKQIYITLSVPKHYNCSTIIWYIRDIVQKQQQNYL